VTVLIVGAGRSGLRHLDGAAALGDVHVVDIRREAEADVLARSERATFGTRLEDAPPAETAILSTTAAGRLETLELLAVRGVREVLLEKPLEQSRARVRRLAEVARDAGVRAYVHLHRRTNPEYRRLRAAGGPYRVVVTGGAFGLACNGVHYLDLAVFLSGSAGRLVHGELEPLTIASGRGSAFRDYGGYGDFAFADGTHLHLSSWAASSAPELVTVVQRDSASVYDGIAALSYARPPGSTEPVFRYGAGWTRAEHGDFETLRGGDTTGRWLEELRAGGEVSLPTLDEALPAHELLFDLLETSGGFEFPFA
jgi:predicted dehydrogenase